MNDKNIGYVVILASYSIAFFCAVFIGFLLESFHPILIVFVSDIVATLIIYIISSIFKNTSIYDPYWSVAPICIAFFYFFYYSLPITTLTWSVVRKLIILILVNIWGIRLTWNWLSSWRGIEHEDWRYRMYRQNYPKAFWVYNLMGLQLMPTILVFLGCLPLYPALLQNDHGFTFFDGIGIIITITAILIETIADKQLHTFIQERESHEEIMKEGLWKYSRHPNYFGEVMFWWGLFFFALSTHYSYWWTIIGALAITILFYFVSIPLMDERNLSRKSNYKEHMKKVSKLILLPQKD
jgi:steroid 5-alpha reductase family enzyme